MTTDLLFQLLQAKRPHGSEYDTSDLILPDDKRRTEYSKGDILMAIRIDTCENPTTIFSCHLDTVDHQYGDNELEVSANNVVSVKGGGVLGADDGAGVALLVHMIENGVKGRFFFFGGEEKGGVGSKYMVDHRPELFDGIKRAIAFDRKGTHDVIVSQMGEEGCSSKFALALCDALSSTTGYQYEPAIGVYTDTAEMFDSIPECCNVSVGYYNEHTSKESLDLTYLTALSKAVCEIDWEALPTVRNPEEAYSKYSSKYEDYDWYDHANYTRLDPVTEILDLMSIHGVTMGNLMDAIKDTKSYDLL